MAKPKFSFNKKTGVVTPRNAAASQLQKKQSGLPNYGEGQQPGIFTSTNPYAAKIDVNTPQQQGILDHLSQLLPQGISGLNLPGQQSSFDAIADEARANYNNNIVPGLAERFASMGSGAGNLNSSSFAKALGGSSKDLERALASLKSEHGLQEQSLQSNNLFNLLSSGLHPQFSAGIVPGQDSTARTVFKKGIPFAADFLKSYLGGPSTNNSSSNNSSANGSGINPNNSFGFTQNPGWTPTYGNLSIKQLANPGYGHLNQSLSGNGF